MHRCFAVFCAVFFVAAPLAAQPLFINELLASNDTTLTDERGDYDDWLELYNGGSQDVDIGGMFVADDEAELDAWQIPTDQPEMTVVPAGGFLLLWFDGEPEEGGLHVDLKLGQGGEWVGLVDRDGETVVDSVRFGEQATDVSYGRLGDGGADWGSFSWPTPLQTNVQAGQVRPPVFSLAPGHYGEPMVLEIDVQDENAVVYYTLDGTEPEPVEALRYERAIALTGVTVVRAMAQIEGQISSPIVTGTYLIGADYSLPVVSLVADPADLFSEESGLLVEGPGVQEGDEWPFWNANWYTQGEKPAHIEFFDAERKFGFGMDVGIELAGGWSRALPKKSFDVKMRAEYGETRLEYPLFPENGYDTYDGLVLRAGAEDFSRTSNEIVYRAHREFGMRVDMQAYKPVVLLLNGQFWGIYSLMERKGADFVDSRHGETDIDLIADWDRVVEGSYDAYQELLGFLNANDVAADSVYAVVRERIGVKSLIDMWLLHVYTNHGDEQNIRYWRPRASGGQWRWIAYDFDWWLDPQAERLQEFAGKTAAEGYRLLGRLLQNGSFKAQFVNRVADFLNTTGTAQNMERLIDAAVAEVAGEIDADLERWSDWEDNSGPFTLDRGDYDWKVGWVREFVRQRPAILRDQIVETFGLPGAAKLTVDREGSGRVEVSTLEPDIFPWSGTYFQGIPVRVEANPRPGYHFAGWAEEGWPGQAELRVELTGDAVLTARFAPVEGAVVINEISYNPADDADSGDWVELLNRSAETVDLSGWRLIGEGGDGFALPEGTRLERGEYLVVVEDGGRFGAVFPLAGNAVGDFGFGLSNGGETVTLLDATGGLVDQVQYGDRDPWPAEADGEGATLELADASADNALAVNWRSSRESGTPGRPNGDRTAVLASWESEGVPVDFALFGNYPNPFNSDTVIGFALPVAEEVELAVYNVAGQRVATLVQGLRPSGVYNVRWDGRSDDGQPLASGVYLYRLRTHSREQTQRLLLLR